MSSVNRKMAAGIAWMSLMRFGIKGLGLISTIILARLLLPSDFGLVAMAMSVVGALDLLRQFSFNLALIQYQGGDRVYYDTAWTLNVLFSLGLALLVYFVAGPAANFFSEPRVVIVMQVIALGLFISGLENIGVVAFLKDLDYQKEFWLRLLQKACGVLISVPLAFALRNYWALIIGIVAGNVITVVISYLMHPFRPRFSLGVAGQLFGFSKWLAANNILWFVRDRTADFALGRVAGTSALGLFTMSNEIASLPTTELVAPINRACFPAYAKMAHDLEALRQGFLNVIGLVVVLALPAGFGIAAVAPFLVPVMLGEKWLDAIPIVSVLAIYGALNALQTNCTAVHYSLGRPRNITVISAIQIVFLLPLAIWGAYRGGAVGIAYAYLGYVIVISLPLNYVVVLRALGMPFRRLLASVWRPLVGAVAMYSAVAVLVAYLREPSLLFLGVAVVAGAAVYAASVLLLWLMVGRPGGPERTAVDNFVLPTWNKFVAARAVR